MVHVHDTLEPALERALRAFLGRCPSETGVVPEHDPAWVAALASGLDHRGLHLIERCDTTGQIRGYLPLTLASSRLFGRCLVSLPFLSRAGAVAQDDAARTALIDQAVQLGVEHDVRYLELRHGGAGADHVKLFVRRAEKFRMAMALPEDRLAMWDGFDPKLRNALRRADRLKLDVQWGAVELLDEFYRVLTVNMRETGTPVQPRKLFDAVLEHLSPRAELAVVTQEGHPVAGALLVHCSGGAGHAPTTLVPAATCLRPAIQQGVTLWMFHHLLQRAITRHSRVFDFGRSSYKSASYRFKRQWGAKPTPTVYQFHVRHMDAGARRPTSPGGVRRSHAWQKMPLWLTRVVGPSLVRAMP